MFKGGQLSLLALGMAFTVAFTANQATAASPTPSADGDTASFASQIHAFAEAVQAKAEGTVQDWKELLQSQLNGQVVSLLPATLPNRSEVYLAMAQKMVEDFAPEILKMYEARTEFFRAKSDLDLAQPEITWFSSPAVLEGVKAKVTELVEQKRKYLVERALLRQEMAQALFNMSESFFAALRQAGDAGRDTHGWSYLLGQMLGLRRDDGGANDAAGATTHQSEGGVDVVIDSVLTPASSDGDDSGSEASRDFQSAQQEQESATSGRGSPSTQGQAAVAPNPWSALGGDAGIWGQAWADYRAKAKQESLQKKSLRLKEGKKNKWRRSAAGEQAAEQQSPEETKAGSQEPSAPTTAAAASAKDELVADITAQLWSQFKTAIEKLNESRNAFLKVRDDMAATANLKPWQKVDNATGNTTFDPLALVSFKLKIRDMVLEKNKYVAEKVKLQQDMLAALNALLPGYLNKAKAATSSAAGAPEAAGIEGDALIDPVLEQLLQLKAGTGAGVEQDVLSGLPFAHSLELAAQADAAGSGNGSGGGGRELVLVAVLGVVAVLAAALLVAGMAVFKPSRRSLYTRMP